MIEHKTFANGFRYIEISNNVAHAKIALQGGHLFHFEAVNQPPLLWLSKTSFLETGKAIRGGVPICWPWFGKHPTDNTLPQHGFARNSDWHLLTAEDIDAHTTKVVLQLQYSVESLKIWPHAFELLLAITVGEHLSMALTTRNCDNQEFTITAALHSYFAVEDISTVSVSGFADTSYLDTVTGEEHIQQGIITIDQEVDRIYRQVAYPVSLHDQRRAVDIDASGSTSAVVWNPWVEKCHAMADMEDDSYKTMLCIETTNALEDGRRLSPGQEHTLTSDISCSGIVMGRVIL